MFGDFNYYFVNSGAGVVGVVVEVLKICIFKFGGVVGRIGHFKIRVISSVG